MVLLLMMMLFIKKRVGGSVSGSFGGDGLLAMAALVLLSLPLLLPLL